MAGATLICMPLLPQKSIHECSIRDYNEPTHMKMLPPAFDQLRVDFNTLLELHAGQDNIIADQRGKDLCGTSGKGLISSLSESNHKPLVKLFVQSGHQRLAEWSGEVRHARYSRWPL